MTAVESESDIFFDPDSFNLHYSYEDENNEIHTVWMMDGVTAYNELRAAERAGVQGTAIWRLGMEDPSIWDIWDATHADDATRISSKNSSGIRLDSRRRWRYLAHHGHPAERPADVRLRFRKRRDRRRELSKLSAFVANSGDGRGAEKSCAYVRRWPRSGMDAANSRRSEAKAGRRDIFRDRRVREPDTRIL